ncbi:hypothetical protein phiOC_p104 [Ochrobactrum phage vB_OspM_OC]|nr:hypothetical protein phiOC_p104 [Ochrobactrum phage vB_OspM_OC]
MYNYAPTIAEWLEVVNKHYGSLDGFHDAPSVRIMLNFCRQHKRDNNKILESIIDDGARKEFEMLFQNETDQINNYEVMLKEWLDKRNLPE